MRNSRFVSCRICRGCGKKTPVRSTPARLFSSGTPQAPGYQDFSVVTIFFPPPSQATRPELQGGHPPPIPLRPQKRHPREGDTPGFLDVSTSDLARGTVCGGNPVDSGIVEARTITETGTGSASPGLSVVVITAHKFDTSSAVDSVPPQPTCRFSASQWDAAGQA